MPDVKTAPGWYPDPDGSARRRFWDGSRWTVHYEPPPTFRDRALARLEQPPVRTSPRSRRGWIIAAGSVTAGFVVAFGSCAFVASRLNFDFGIQPPLEPIPVPSASCAYLRRVHHTAVVAGMASGAAAHDKDPAAWKTEAASVDVKLTAFAGALRAAEAHTPAPIAARLRLVREQVGVGRRQLRRSRTGIEWSNGTFDAVAHGYSSLGAASQLTGDACGFTVAPDPNVYFDQVSTASP